MKEETKNKIIKRIKDRHFRTTGIGHDGDCGIYHLGICTCGLFHDLLYFAGNEDIIRDLYPKYDEQIEKQYYTEYVLELMNFDELWQICGKCNGKGCEKCKEKGIILVPSFHKIKYKNCPSCEEGKMKRDANFSQKEKYGKIEAECFEKCDKCGFIIKKEIGKNKNGN